MGTHRSYWHILIGMLGLMIILAACGGGSTTSGTSSTATPQATNTPASSGGNATILPTTSTVSFTSSGGLTGTFTISDNDTASNYGKNLGLQVHNQKWIFLLSYSTYTGPGTYTIKFTSPLLGSVELISKDFTKRWGFSSSSSCQLTIESDTDLKKGTGSAGYTDYHEVKGRFSCPSLSSQSASPTSPITLTNGQFDVIAPAVPA